MIINCCTTYCCKIWCYSKIIFTCLCIIWTITRTLSSKFSNSCNIFWIFYSRWDIEKQKYPSSDYSEQDKSYCRCVAHVAAKGNVRSPYAVCTSRVGHTPGERISCTNYYSNEYIFEILYLMWNFYLIFLSSFFFLTTVHIYFMIKPNIY